MDQLKKLFATLSLAQKVALGAVILFIAIGTPMFTRWQHEGDFKPLFTGMAPEDAGAIITKLKETGVDHRLADNGTSVLVPSDKVDEVRLGLAGEGLPKTGRIGFELFDKTNISLTDFGEHVNYRRAVEGELEKTIKSIIGIDQARVHVTFPKDSVFLDSREPAKASVLVHVRPGVHLAAQNVVAIANLAASAVESLSPDAVSVVDMQGNLLSRQQRRSYDSDGAEATLDYKHQVEKDLASKVEATLDPLLGPGKFRVGVTAECDFSTSEQTDEVYDPTRSVMSNSQKTEDLSQGAATAGIPGTPSNLPRSQIRTQNSAGSGGPSVSRRTESSSFETTRTVRQVKVPRGVIKKLSAALLIDQDASWQGKGNQRKRVLLPPSPEKLKSIHDIVAGVLGISAERGDQLVVETLPFESTRNTEDVASEMTTPQLPAKPTLKDLMADKKILIGAGVGLLFVLLLMTFLLRKPKTVLVPMEARVASSESVSTNAAIEAKPNAAPGGAAKEIEDLIPMLQLPEINSHAKELIDHFRKSINKDPEAAANVIRGWMEEA